MRADRRRQQQAEDERPREDRGHEFPDRHQEDLLHTATAFGSAPACSCARRTLGVRRRRSARDDADEDVFEARPGDFDARGRDGAGQARDGARRVRAVRRAGSRSRRRPARRARLRGARASGDRSASRSSGSNRIARGSYWRRIVDSGSSSTFLPAVHHHDVIAQFLGVRHHVRGEQDRRAALVLLVDQRRAALRALTGSRPLNGSSRISRSGSWMMAARNCTFCCMPFESSSQRLRSQSPRPTRSRPRRMRPGSSRVADALEPAEVGEKRADPHLPVDAALLRQIADAVLGVERRRVAEHRQRRPSPER